MIILSDNERMQLIIIRIPYADVLTTNMRSEFPLKLITKQSLVLPD